AVAGVDCGLSSRSLSAQIGVPSVVPRPSGLRARLADLVGSGQPAQLGSIAGACAGDEEGHGLLRGLLRGLLCENERRPEQYQERIQDDYRLDPCHLCLLAVSCGHRRWPVATCRWKVNTSPAPAQLG